MFYFNTNKPQFSFLFAEYRLFKRGEGVRTPCTLPLDPHLRDMLVLGIYDTTAITVSWFKIDLLKPM